MAFHKQRNEWLAFRSDCGDERCLSRIASQYPSRTQWTVTFDGRRLGKVTGRTPKEFNFYSQVGLQELEDRATVPWVGKRSPEFGGYIEASVFRPLVVVSQPYFTDPEGWKVSQLPADAVTLLRAQFRRQNPRLCKASEQHEGKLEPFAYSDEDVKLVKSYNSIAGWTVARIHLEEAIDCADVEAGFEIDDQWFVLAPNKAARYLDSGMWLVDAGDYDNDGKSELLFSINRENRGGYELFYDGFKKRSVFEYSYH